jgi:hypothetical protein
VNRDDDRGADQLATEAREDLGGDAQVRIAYPLRAALGFVTVPYSTDPDELYGPTSSPR